MPDRNTLTRCVARTVRRWLPGAQSIAGAAAAAGDPAPLLDLDPELGSRHGAADPE
jgi:hypothetical protein